MPLTSLAYKLVDFPLEILPESLQDMLSEHQAHMQSYAYAIVRNAQDAEDIVQNVMIIALKKDELLSHENPIGWLLKTTRFEAMNYFRKNKRMKVGLDPEVMTLLEESVVEEPAPENPLTEKVRWCLKQLKVKYQKLFKWRYEDEIKGEELAKKCGLKKEAMYKVLSRSQEILKKCIERQESPSDVE